MPYSDKHIFFDLDRTLWDFDKNSETALKILFEQERLHTYISDFEVFHKEYKNRNQALWIRYGKGKITKDELRYERFRSTFKKLGIHNEVLVRNFGDGYVEISPKQTCLKPFAKNVLMDLKDMNFNLHIITNGFAEVQSIKMNCAGLDPFFDAIICSEDIGHNKPDKRIFHHAFLKSGASKEVSLMVGDDYKADIMGALNAGMKAIWYDSENYRKSKYEAKVTCLSEIPQLAAKLLREP